MCVKPLVFVKMSPEKNGDHPYILKLFITTTLLSAAELSKGLIAMLGDKENQ